MLLERDSELATLEGLLDGGGVVVVEGGAGIGKTSLLGACCERARRRGWRVLRGSGSELETGFAFGLVRQLFERDLASSSPQERAELVAGPAGPAGELRWRHRRPATNGTRRTGPPLACSNEMALRLGWSLLI